VDRASTALPKIESRGGGDLESPCSFGYLSSSSATHLFAKCGGPSTRQAAQVPEIDDLPCSDHKLLGPELLPRKQHQLPCGDSIDLSFSRDAA
jgi:hypothetical protein